MTQIVRNFKNHISNLKILFPLLLNCIITYQCPKDIAGNCSCRVTIAVMINSSNDTSGEVSLIPE